ncbi:hypothetical protein U5801_11000 [Lamprobacter modestohalophilus]|uniref:hypothetical protein n=1 Tax=Lamprobacter modestohalophilus TaxID=1064514 RepID=UPI002ADEABC3|nr:hypothetical protein [Lamprobacter modestohalophilus]MEA1050330.1 hypothetical protein [Lamprobacter modestohalophilus]
MARSAAKKYASVDIVPAECAIEHGDAMLPVRIEPLAHNLITRSVMSRAEINGRQIPGPGNSSKFFGS